ncbi:MAG: hypothetical protein HYS40_03290 [Gemmatimonadetes bacterium]|nr:hypothetical protein [Gemmatimonadota bacterium]
MRTAGRLGGWAVRAALPPLLLTAYPPTRLTAQVEVHLSAGARYTSTLVRDQIVAPLTIRPAIGPALALTVIERSGGLWAGDATLDLSWGGLERHDAGGSSQRINSLTTLALTVGVRRQLLPGMVGRAGVGGLKYFPGDESGVFRDGAGVAALVSVAVDFAPPFAARRRLGITARYDAHHFLTPALRSVGFFESRLVHRVALTVRARLVGTP